MLLSSDAEHLSSPPPLIYLYWEKRMVRGHFSPPELSSCFHGNPCLAADLLCTGKGREKGGLEGEEDGWEGEKAANEI